MLFWNFNEVGNDCTGPNERGFARSYNFFRLFETVSCQNYDVCVFANQQLKSLLCYGVMEQIIIKCFLLF